MKTIAVIQETDIHPDTENQNNNGFNHRQAARAVVLNQSGQVALLWVGKNNYHKLPGGGVENKEDIRQALERELLEEIGCKAVVENEIGEIIEFRDQWRLKQTSYCFIARQTGEHVLPAFTEQELEDGFEIKWVDDFDTAIELVKNDSPLSYEGDFIQKRDLLFLETAKAEF
jgi:8-oxo-dGTP diphosphatase